MKNEKKNNALVSFLSRLCGPAKPPSTSLENVTSSKITVEEATGSHLFKIERYAIQKRNAKGRYLMSATFKAGGYDWCLIYYPNGDTRAKYQDTSIYLRLVSNVEGNVAAHWTYTFFNQKGRQLWKGQQSNIYTFNRKSNSWGYSSFVKKWLFESGVGKDDCLVIKCDVTIVKHSLMDSTDPIVVPPGDMHRQLGYLLETPDNGADITFEVDGKTFACHRCILHARAPIFLENFVGQMKEELDHPRIKIKEMEAPVFKALLHFIYNDSLSGFGETKGYDEKHDTRLLTRELLVVADRYGLERLRMTCEKILSNTVDTYNVVPLLSFAESHSCSHLKTSCLKYLACPRTLGEVVETEEFQVLVKCHPSILKELLEKRV